MANETTEILKNIYSSSQFRKELANLDMFWFFSIYFHHYIEYKSAEFQKEIFSLVSNDKHKIVAITAFRNSAKSTICTLILPIWAVLGKWKKKYVVLVCQNQSRAKDTLANIRIELEEFNLLAQDYQPKSGKTDKWSEEAIIIPKYNAKIAAISTGEAIRGIRHLQHRPDLIICDDLEDVPSCQNYEARKKLWQFVNGELIPAGDTDTKYIFIGNKVHNDSLMMKLKKVIESGRMNGVYREYPLVNEKGEIAWPDKFPTMEAVKELKSNYGSEVDFLREQMLKILPDGDAIVKPDDINYYQELPEADPDAYIISVDPAFSQKSSADNTAVLTLAIYRVDKKIKIYILPYVVNQKLGSDDLIEKIKYIISNYTNDSSVRVFVEEVSAQTTLIETLVNYNIPADGVKIGGKDKKARLSAISPWIKNGLILFPTNKSVVLINQLLYFGTEKYDDLVDALTLAVNKLIKEENQPKNQVRIVKYKRSFYDSAMPKSIEKDWADKEDEEIFGNLKRR